MDRFLLWPKLAIQTKNSVNIVECENGFYDRTSVLNTKLEDYMKNIVQYKNYYVMKGEYYLFIFDKNYKLVTKHWWGPINDFEIVGNDIMRIMHSNIEIYEFDKPEDNIKMKQNIELEGEIKMIGKINEETFVSYTGRGRARIYKKEGDRYEVKDEKEILTFTSVEMYGKKIYGIKDRYVSIYSVEKGEIRGERAIKIPYKNFYITKMLNEKEVWIYWVGNKGLIYDIEKEKTVKEMSRDPVRIGEKYICNWEFFNRDIEFYGNGEEIARYESREEIRNIKMLPASEIQRERMSERIGEVLRMSMDVLGMVVDYCGME